MTNTYQSSPPQGNYQALPILKIDDQNASPELMEDLLQVIVEESLHMPGMFTLVIRNDYQPGKEGESPWKYEDILQIGKPIKIGFTPSTTESSDFSDDASQYLLEGEITAIEAHFSDTTQAPILVRGYDVSHRLHRGRWNRSFQNMTDSDIVKKIVKEVGIETGTIDESGEPHDYIFQENQTNMEFLRERAARHGFDLFVQLDNKGGKGKLNFRKPKKAQGTGENLKLKWLTDVHSFRVRVTSTEQVQKVEVRAWDYKEKRDRVGIAQKEEVMTETQQGKGSAVSTSFQDKPPEPTLYVVDKPISYPKEVERMAQAICNEVGGQYIFADAKGEGNPKIRVGGMVELEDMGKHSGKYYVTETRHSFYERIYTTEFSVRGLRAGNILETLSPSQRLKPGQTFLVGVVTNNEDPEGWGRVKVWFPSLTPQEGDKAHASNWARVVSIGSGAERGIDCLPEIDDEVLVGFEHGDINRPYVLGGVWNGKDAPPEKVEDSVKEGKVRLRTLKTRTGHKVQFVEEDKGNSKAGIYIETTGGHQLSCNDSETLMEIKTSGGHQVKLDDKGKALEIKTSGGHQLKLDDSGSNVTINSSGSLSINAKSSLEISATGSLKITAAGELVLQGAVIKLN